jgi:phycocyanobilin:ferredoxin oxidoreductase
MIKRLYDEHKKISDSFLQNIKYQSSIENKDDIIWKNDIYINPVIRYGHLEYFKSTNGKIEVLHCTFFPSYFKDFPIYGFDVIALGDKVTGLFCDFTETVKENLFFSKKLKEIKQKYQSNERNLPEWANFFSKNFVCMSPKDLNQDEIVLDFLELFKVYVDQMEWCNFNGIYNSTTDIKKSIDIQNNYSINQRKNDKTYKALSAYIGEDSAREFIDTVLFPTYIKD